jgi:FKBP-type peptidyl-prolyl cis-trans isomerase SlyD
MTEEDAAEEHDHDHDHGEAAEETADAGADSGTGGVDEDAIQDGDVIRIDYTARTVDDGTVVDTTDSEVAEEAGVDEQGDFEPRVIVVGAGHLFEAVEADLIGKSVGDTGTVTITPEEAFGEYDQDEIRTISADRLDEENRRPGAQVTVDGERGYVETVIGGRARVDFNHPLAGEEIEYEYEIAERLEDKLEIAQGLMSTFIDVAHHKHVGVGEVEEVGPRVAVAAGGGTEAADEDEDEGGGEIPGPEFETVTVERETLVIEVTPQLSFNQQWLFRKRDLAQQLLQHADVDRVVLQETIDGSGMGMGMGGTMGGMGGAPAPGDAGGDVEEAIEEADVDAEEIMEEIEAADES